MAAILIGFAEEDASQRELFHQWLWEIFRF
jgi:hypothetical protein